MTNLRGLTGARGIAAWFVVLYHLRFSLGVSPSMMDVLAKGYLAVDFFFVLSGFVIWLSYVDRIRTRRWAAVPDFLLRRIARIWPLHLAMLAFAVALAGLLFVTGRPADPRFDFADLPAHIFLVQNWRGYGSLDWNDPAWSISCELFAYLLFPLLALSIDWRRLPTWAIIGAISLVIAVLASIMALRGLTTLGQFIPQFGLLRCTAEFTCGTAVAALWLRYRDAPRLPFILASVVAIIAFATFVSGAVIEMASIPATFVALVLALALTANVSGNPLAGRALVYLGDISFATYLSHSLLWKAYKLVFVRDVSAVPMLTMIAFLLLVLATSVSLYHLVERPAQRWLNRLPSRLREGLGEGRP